MTRPELIMLAGPNGAGKSTFYDIYLADSPLLFLNADVLSARSGIEAQEAARVLDQLRHTLIDRGESFITETVFSDPVGSKLGLLEKAVANDYDVSLLYVGIEPKLAPLRIEQRVALGGHDVPRDRVLSRFRRSLDNLRLALRLAITVEIYDNSRAADPHRLLARFESGARTFRTSDRVPGWARELVGPKRSRR